MLAPLAGRPVLEERGERLPAHADRLLPFARSPVDAALADQQLTELGPTALHDHREVGVHDLLSREVHLDVVLRHRRTLRGGG